MATLHRFPSRLVRGPDGTDGRAHSFWLDRSTQRISTSSGGSLAVRLLLGWNPARNVTFPDSPKTCSTIEREGNQIVITRWCWAEAHPTLPLYLLSTTRSTARDSLACRDQCPSAPGVRRCVRFACRSRTILVADEYYATSESRRHPTRRGSPS